MTVIVNSANPHVPHQQREADHHRADAEGATELELTGFIGLRIFATGRLGWATARTAIGAEQGAGTIGLLGGRGGFEDLRGAR